MDTAPTPPRTSNNHLGAAFEIIRRIEATGHTALIVGGAVRDQLMGLPVKDIDLATSMPLADLAILFRIHDIGRNKAFGIVVVPWQGYSFEIARFRGETDFDGNGAPCSMGASSTFAEDASRRDFTINAMAMDAQCRILDPEGGWADIEAGLIRAVRNPAERLTEDPLRMVRAVRFAVRHGFRIEEQTRQAIGSLAPRLASVAVERLADELMKMASLSGPALAAAIRLLADLGLLTHILPDVQALAGLAHEPRHHPEGDVFAHTLAAVSASTSRDPAVNLAILFHDLGKATTLCLREQRPTYHGHAQAGVPIITALAERLRLPARLVRAITFATENHMKGYALGEMRPSSVLKLVLDEHWPLLKEVMRCDCAARGDNQTMHDMEEMLGQAEETAAAWRTKVTKRGLVIISGQRVLELTGLPPGPKIGTIISQVTEWAMDRGMHDQEAIAAEVRRIAAELTPLQVGPIGRD